MVPSIKTPWYRPFFYERMRFMKIKPKDKFRHFKGNIIEVVCVAKHSETLEDMVVYTHNNEYWVRPSETEKPKAASQVENACYW